ncbi:unnamed protein product [Spirodela intermedia]|uniref:Uncharacterized protein n=1 Tax=Spirodela intermedia TaxID=51605 RepID=A0A7I8KIB5_SPIIN|nr:unnamed protein product [Spirodela intermedia]
MRGRGRRSAPVRHCMADDGTVKGSAWPCSSPVEPPGGARRCWISCPCG